MTWEEIDTRLENLRRDRRWLAEKSGYTYDTVRNILAPNFKRRTDRMLATLRRVIEDEEVTQGLTEAPTLPATGEIAPGIWQIFRTDTELDRADRASRIAGADSLVEFCRDCIFTAADELLAQEQQPPAADPRPVYRYPALEPAPAPRAADAKE